MNDDGPWSLAEQTKTLGRSSMARPMRCYAEQFAVVTLIAAVVLQGDGLAQRGRELASLTVPSEGLSASCRLSPSAMEPPKPRAGDRVVAGLWSGLPIPENPYFGDDLSVAIAVRERVVRRVRMPDGPPLSAAELQRFRSRAAEDVVDTYVGVYADSESRLVSVYALRFKPGAPDAARHPALSDELYRRLSSDVLVVVSGSGICADPVLEHVVAALQR